ncbi:MAG TPA: hypothetical protein VM686_25345 [Polyangiaceae bacterium]|jgi:hypothetical protein|nr:hypothetical protein [Polyangiaceae bacterium]
MTKPYKSLGKTFGKAGRKAGKAVRNNPIKLGLGASLMSLAAFAVQSPRLRMRAREIAGDLKRRLSRHSEVTIGT